MSTLGPTNVPPYQHPTTIPEWDTIYRREYREELAACDRWIAFCEKTGDLYGVNFHEGMRAALVFHHMKTEQLLRVIKQEPPNATRK